MYERKTYLLSCTSPAWFYLYSTTLLFVRVLNLSGSFCCQVVKISGTCGRYTDNWVCDLRGTIELQLKSNWKQLMTRFAVREVERPTLSKRTASVVACRCKANLPKVSENLGRHVVLRDEMRFKFVICKNKLSSSHNWAVYLHYLQA